MGRLGPVRRTRHALRGDCHTWCHRQCVTVGQIRALGVAAAVKCAHEETRASAKRWRPTRAKDGRGDWNRTSDLLNPIQARYQICATPRRELEGGVYCEFVRGKRNPAEAAGPGRPAARVAAASASDVKRKPRRMRRRAYEPSRPQHVHHLLIAARRIATVALPRPPGRTLARMGRRGECGVESC